MSNFCQFFGYVYRESKSSELGQGRPGSSQIREHRYEVCRHPEMKQLFVNGFLFYRELGCDGRIEKCVLEDSRQELK